MRRSPAFLIAMNAALVVAIFVAAALVVNDSNAIDNVHWAGLPLPPCFVSPKACGGHLLGTDEVGRDLLDRLIVGGAVSLGLSLLAAGFELVVLVLLNRARRIGAPSVARTVLFSADAVSLFAAWPLVAAVAVFSFREPSLVRLPTIALAAGVLMAFRAVSLDRSSQATQPLVLRPLRDWALIMLMLATIDFFGLGVQPPTASWGNILAAMQTSLALAWWAAVFPGVALFVAAVLIRIAAPIQFRRPSAD